MKLAQGPIDMAQVESISEISLCQFFRTKKLPKVDPDSSFMSEFDNIFTLHGYKMGNFKSLSLNHAHF